MHAAKQTRKSKKMITVQVRDKNVIDGLELGFKPTKLDLCGLSAIDKKIPLGDVQQLGADISAAGWAGGGTSEYEQFKTLAHAV